MDEMVELFCEVITSYNFICCAKFEIILTLILYVLHVFSHIVSTGEVLGYQIMKQIFLMSPVMYSRSISVAYFCSFAAVYVVVVCNCMHETLFPGNAYYGPYSQ